MFSEQELIYRLILTGILTGIIGLQRELFGKPAGFRTHILVGLGACLVMISGIKLHMQFPNTMPDRLAAQVVSGVGFLGAGSIIKEGKNIEGLTTGASLWLSGCLGIAIGSGFLDGAFVTVMVTLFILEIKTYRKIIFKINLFFKKTPKVGYILKQEQYFYLTINDKIYTDKESAKKLYLPFSTYKKIIARYSKKDYIDIHSKPKGYTTVYKQEADISKVIREIKRMYENKNIYK